MLSEIARAEEREKRALSTLAFIVCAAGNLLAPTHSCNEMNELLRQSRSEFVCILANVSLISGWQFKEKNSIYRETQKASESNSSCERIEISMK